jgi:hypothetical protein
MSYDTDMRVWVGDLDGYVNIDAISRANQLEAEEYAMEADLDGMGDISLFSNQTISSRKIHSRGVNPEQWRWMLHRAEKSLGQMDTHADIEKAFIKATMSGARRYAVARYAGFEGLSFSDAITAVYPHGIRALLFSYMAGEQSLSDRSYRKEIQRTLHLAASTPDLTAYDRAGLVRRYLHELAIDEAGRSAFLKLDKVRMRNTLSLLRLYFSNLECQVQSAAELLKIQLRYEAARAAEKQGFDTSQKITGKKVQNWRLRSLQPLTFYFPYSVRHALKRLIDQDPSSAGLMDHKSAVNELALSYCEIELMRLRGREKAKQGG